MNPAANAIPLVDHTEATNLANCWRVHQMLEVCHVNLARKAFMLAIAVGIPTGLFAQESPRMIAPADPEMTRKIQWESRQVGAAVNIEWVSNNCQNELTAETIQQAKDFLTRHANQKLVAELRDYYQRGAKQFKEPCSLASDTLPKDVEIVATSR